MLTQLKSILFTKEKHHYWLTRYVFLRFLALIYLFAFLALVFQGSPLIGEKGLTPADQFLDRVGEAQPSSAHAFFALPSIFWLGFNDTLLLVFAWVGVLTSLLVLIGYANSILMFLLWFLYLSFYHIGQLWYSFGWETQLLETGFLAIFFVPFLDWKPFPKTPPPYAIVLLLRWLTFRIHLGSGLIKIRGDECWEKLSCLFYHFETQPIPHGLSRFYHFLPAWMHQLGVLFSHISQIFVPFFVFAKKHLRHIAGVILVAFQVILISSGNLAFLNWITLAAVIGCFDDSFWRKILPQQLVKKAKYAQLHHKKPNHLIVWVVFAILLLMSAPVVHNLFLSDRQLMNSSFNQWHLVNTYGAFGSITKERFELIIEGSNDLENWQEYHFYGKPGDIDSTATFFGPYHMRLDWLMWFAAFGPVERSPWVIHVVWKLLHNDEQLLSIMGETPFANNPPQFIRVQYYRYTFAETDHVWDRELVGAWLGPLSKETPELRAFIANNGWEMYE